MQKVEGSSPFSRFLRRPRPGGAFVVSGVGLAVLRAEELAVEDRELTGAPDDEAPRALSEAFPEAMRAEAEIALRTLRTPEIGPRFHSAPVTLDGETLWIPSRIYNAEPPPPALEALTPQRRLFMHCVLSRHNDGFVRERHAEAIVKSDALFAVPFIVALAADYVVEIVETVRAGLPELNTYPSPEFETFGRFLFDNPQQLELVRQRTISFWNEHHRSSIPRGSYPGFALLNGFDRAVAHQANKPRNRQRRRAR